MISGDTPPVGIPGATESASEGWALVVDDNPIDRRIAGTHVASATGLPVQYASDGLEALAAMKKSLPTIVLTDLLMPNMDGLELVDQITCNFSTVPVVLMTSKGSEEIAIEALRRGAASYVPKRIIETLAEILPQVLMRARAERRRYELNEYVQKLDYDLALDNEPALIPLLVVQLTDFLFGMKLCSANEKNRVGVALEEALLNGLYHGNLEVSSELKEDGSDAFTRLAEERRRTSPYRERRLRVLARLNDAEAFFQITDDGPGFDPSTLPDPTDPENLLKASGRGMLLIRTFMDEVTHSAKGNQITMLKRRKEAKAGACP